MRPEMGCTELPLVVKQANSALSILDSKRLRADAVVRKSIGEAAY